ncbi:hypothetical protein EXS71_02095 [Candidatus Uhrbacteria bacterium]|nr:hypothetical protein [Candidatus Uhrbacteria bacterium]
MLKKGLTSPTQTRSNIWSRVFVVGFMFLLAMTFISGSEVFAQTAQGVKNVQTTANAAGLGGSGSDLFTIIGRIINVALGLLGIILVGILMYAGFLYYTSGGEMERAKTAKLYIYRAIVGLIIIMFAFAIVNFVLGKLAEISAPSGGIIGTGIGNIGFPGSAGSLGGGIIEYHLPIRDATGVPRNTPVIITFKEPMKLSTLIKGYDDKGTPADLSDDVKSTDLNTDVIKIYPTGHADKFLTTKQVAVRFTKDRKTFVMKPVEFLGSAIEKMGYSVEFGTGLTRENGQPAFAGAFANGYKWSFEVSTVIDITPPKIVSVIPGAGGVYAPNILIQINFDEAIDPTGASGIWKDGQGFTNLEVSAKPLGGGPSVRPNGEFKVSNGYTTVEFTTDLSCGINTCGRKIFCLPGTSAISSLVKAASLSSTPPQALLSESGYDGVTDVVGNSLDGNRDAVAQGPAQDNYSWNFGTSDKPNLDPPFIKVTQPRAGDAGIWQQTGGSSVIPVDQAPRADFDSILQASTITTDSSLIQTNEPAELKDTFWWTPRQVLLTVKGEEVSSTEMIPYSARLSINHRLYLPATTSSKTAIPEYDPSFISDIQNVYQNCFNPGGSKTCSADFASPNCCDETVSGKECPYPLFKFKP